MDRISNLPDEIILQIGSFISAKEAALTTVLSKRWRNLFTIIQGLRFDDLVENGECLEDFSDRVMSLRGKDSRVRDFSVKLWDIDEDYYPYYYDHINTCLRHVMNHGVFDIDLSIYAFGGYSYSLPLEVFTCRTVTKLSLGFLFPVDMVPKNALLPSLKKLYLKFVKFGGDCAFKSLLAASSVLEELIMCVANWEDWKWSCTVSSLSLKRLTVRRNLWKTVDHSDLNSISFDTPALVYLAYSDYLPKEYLDVNLNSLVEAKLSLYPRESSTWSDGDLDHLNLLHGLKNVEILNLQSPQTFKMFDVVDEAVPVFEKLSHLSVSLRNICWFPMKVLVKKSPNLKTLTIDGSLHYPAIDPLCHCVSQYSFLESCPLEVLKITEYYGTRDELTQMEYILGKLSCLELVEVCAPVETSERMLELESDLQKLPKASSKCNIQVLRKTKKQESILCC